MTKIGNDEIEILPHPSGSGLNNDVHMRNAESHESSEGTNAELEAVNQASTSRSLTEDGSLDGLLSKETLDRDSPILWPEPIPGVTEFLAHTSPTLLESTNTDNDPPEWLRDLDQDDINTLHGFGSLTMTALLDKVKELQNLAFQLGLEEAHEMNRGRFLNILGTYKKPNRR